MNLSDLIEEFIELKIQGEPAYREYNSIEANSLARIGYENRLMVLKQEIDTIIYNCGNFHNE